MVRIGDRRFISISIFSVLVLNEFLHLPDMGSVQDHVATIPDQTFSIWAFHPVCQSNNDEIIFVQKVTEICQ